jgi:hypothetical protein
MLQRRLAELFKDVDPTIQRVVARVIQLEHAKLSLRNPQGLVEEVCQIIEEEISDETD